MLKIEVLADIKDAVNQINDFQKKSTDSLEKIAKAGNKSFSGLSGSVVAFNQALELGKKVFTAFSATFGEAIDSANKQEESIVALNSALATNGQYTKEVSDDFQQFANDLQAATNIGDDTALMAISLASSMGVTNDQMKDLIKAAGDMSVRFGGDLNTNVQKLAKSMIDGGTSLKRYGIEVEESNTRSGKLANTIKAVADQMGGAAAQKADTFSGTLEGVKNAYGEVLEALGMVVIKSTTSINVMGSLRDTLNNLANAALKLPKILNENRKTLEYLGAAIGTVAVGIGIYVAATNIATISTAAFAGALAIITSPVTLVIASLSALGVAAYALYDNWEDVTLFLQTSLIKTQAAFYNFTAAAIEAIIPLESGFRGIMADILVAFANTGGTLIQKAVDLGSSFASIFGVTLPESLTSFKNNLLETSEEVRIGKSALDEYAESARIQAQVLSENVTTLQANREAEIAIEQAAADAKSNIDLSATEKQLLNQSKIVADKKKTQKEMTDEEKRNAEARKKIAEDEARRKIEIKKKQDEQFYFTENAKKKWEESTWLERIQTTNTGLDALANLQKSSNKSIAAIGKAAAISRAITDTYAAATAAYSSLAGIPIVGPGLGAAAAAAAIAAGFANVNAIRSNSPAFESGGIVGGTSFSGDNVTARVNSGEMILNRNQQARLFNQINASSSDGSLIQAIMNLGNRIANIEIVLRADDIEIARSVNRAIESGYALARTA